MNKVRLEAEEVKTGIIDLALTFIQKATEQGFEIEWVEMVINKIEQGHYHHARSIFLEHVDIIDAESSL